MIAHRQHRRSAAGAPGMAGGGGTGEGDQFGQHRIVAGQALFQRQALKALVQHFRQIGDRQLEEVGRTLPALQQGAEHRRRRWTGLQHVPVPVTQQGREGRVIVHHRLEDCPERRDGLRRQRGGRIGTGKAGRVQQLVALRQWQRQRFGQHQHHLAAGGRPPGFQKAHVARAHPRLQRKRQLRQAPSGPRCLQRGAERAGFIQFGPACHQGMMAASGRGAMTPKVSAGMMRRVAIAHQQRQHHQPCGLIPEHQPADLLEGQIPIGQQRVVELLHGIMFAHPALVFLAQLDDFAFADDLAAR